MTKKVVLITGASSGMGLEATKLFANRGWEVYAGARRVEKIPAGTHIHPIRLDVTDSQSNHDFVQTVIDGQHQVDVLINNAGYGEFGPLEEVSTAKVHKQLDTNLVGASELAQLVLPTMRRQQGGRIVNVSSIGGDMYSPMGGWYYVTKHGLNVWSDTLDTEVSQFGIRSVIVEPGGTASSWSEIAMANATKNLKPNSPYGKLANGMVSLFGRMGGRSSATSGDLAQLFYKAATDKRPQRRYFHSLSDRLMGHFSRVHLSTFHAAMNIATKRLLK